MLLIIELLFLVAGLWMIVSGKIPARLFRFLFGKGEYELSSNKSRLFGLFLSSPIPMSFIVYALFTVLIDSKGTGNATFFDYFYITVIIIVSIIIARKIRHPEEREIYNSQLVAATSEQKTSNYGLRLLIFLGIVILSFVTVTSCGSLVGFLIGYIEVGAPGTGNFWSDIFPFILVVSITGIGLFGIIKLVQILRKKS